VNAEMRIHHVPYNILRKLQNILHTLANTRINTWLVAVTRVRPIPPRNGVRFLAKQTALSLFKNFRPALVPSQAPYFVVPRV